MADAKEYIDAQGLATAMQDAVKTVLIERPADAVKRVGELLVAASAKNVGQLTYFAGLRSRGEPPQLIAAYGGVKMDIELIDFPEWGKRKSEKLPFMPYITSSDGSIMLDSVPICKYLATVGGKFVVDEATEELCKIANSAPVHLADPWYNLPDGGLSLGVPAYEETIAGAIGVVKDYAAKLGDGPFFSGATPGFGEAFVWHNLDNMFQLCKADIAAALGEADMAKLEAFYARFAALDGVKDYLAKRPKVWGAPGSKANPQ